MARLGKSNAITGFTAFVLVTASLFGQTAQVKVAMVSAGAAILDNGSLLNIGQTLSRCYVGRGFCVRIQLYSANAVIGPKQYEPGRHQPRNHDAERTVSIHFSDPTGPQLCSASFIWSGRPFGQTSAPGHNCHSQIPTQGFIRGGFIAC